MTTSEPSPQNALLPMELPLTSSAVDFRAKTLAMREPGRALMARAAGFGQKSAGWLASLDRDSSSWKTSQLCLTESGGLGLAEFSEIWPRSGMMRSGIAYRLPPLAPLTKGIGSGSWPTPRKTMKRGWMAYLRANARGNLEEVLGALGDRGPINPTWVEWLMGFPIGWSEIKPSETP